MSMCPDSLQFRDPRTQPLPRDDAFREYLATGWGAVDRSVDLAEGAGAAAGRHRDAISAQFPGHWLVVTAGRAVTRANDTEFPFRPDSDFVWLTSCQAEGAVLVMRPTAGGHDATLYLAEPVGPGEEAFYADAMRGELWIGPSAGLPQWAEALGIEVRSLEVLDESLALVPADALRAGAPEPRVDGRFAASRALLIALSAAKLLKDDWEIAQLRAAVDATVGGFRSVVRELPAAIEFGGERWLQSTFERYARTFGNGVGYSTIIGSGPHAPTLHWTRCDGPVLPEHLILMDAGVEARSLYTADVTRTFPASGSYSAAQREVHDHVERAHRAAMSQVGPGRSFIDMRNTAYEQIATSLRDLGILQVSVDEAMSPNGQQHRRYLPSGTGHHLGLDVHDCARIGDERYLDEPLQPGAVLTVEPGLYFHANDLTVPPELRGIGVRIEDDLLVTATGHEVLSAALPISADGLEAWLRS
ncbi:M24 family metallopeptidase [Plantibacter sp. MCCC 1A11337]|uniref:aminopeptidase P family protein n=1 Tax=Plantibacter sp. MCCC 1A11337 TaxID=2736644 RepID=UPI001581BE19|nr:aminopeptidase P family protein [Plantibacter sp. MCCC 1A11337]NUJ87909.1 M24 family metallopeptidase [Plantibacter sp. MCCC 1A11337]